MKVSIQDLAENYLKSRTDKDFAKLYNRLMPGVKKFTYDLLQKCKMDSTDVMNDVTSSAFVKILTKIEQYDSTWNFSTWVYRIVKNEALSEIKRLNKIVYLSTIDNGESFEPCEMDNVINKDDYIVKELKSNAEYQHEEFYKLYDNTVNAIYSIKSLYKDVLIDREINNMRYADMAKKYDLPIGTVKTRLKNGRKKIKNVIAKEFDLSIYCY